MKRVAVFGNAGGGKSTLARTLAELTQLPLHPLHYRWATKRLFQGLFATPEGWPEGSPILSSTLSCYRTIWLCHRHLTPKYRELVSEARAQKRVHHLRSPAEMAVLLVEVGKSL